MKKIISLLLAVLMLSSLIACSGGNENDQTTTTTTTKSTTTRRQDPDSEIPDPDEDPGLEYDVNVYLTYGTPVVDGVKETTWDSADAVKLEMVMKDSPEADVTAYQMWDNERLYFLFEIIDSDIFQEGPEGDHFDDSIYLYISELCSFEISAFADYTEGTYQFSLVNDELSKFPRYGDQDLTEDDYDVSFNKTDEGLIIEFSYAPKHLTLEAGKQICLDYQYNDNATGKDRLGIWSWFRTVNGAASPLQMGIGELLAEGTAIPE